MVRVVSRGEWGAPSRMYATVAPHSRVFIHHTVTGYAGGIVNVMRTLENIAVGRGFNGVSYLHVVPAGGSDADKIGEGRGYRKLGAHTLGYNGEYGAAWACDCSQLVPSDTAIATMAEAIRLGMFSGAIRPAPPIDPHSKVYATACCGDGGRAALGRLREQVTAGTRPGGFLMALSDAEQQYVYDKIRQFTDAGVPGFGLESGWQTLLKLRDAVTVIYEHVASEATETGKDPFGVPPMRGMLKRQHDALGVGLVALDGKIDQQVDTDALAVRIVSELGPEFAGALAADLRSALADVRVNVELEV